MPVRLSVCPSLRLTLRMEKIGSQLTDVYQILYLNIFRKFFRENLNFVEI